MVKAFGNLVNRVMEGPQGGVPKEGDGCTYTHFSDRWAGTIVKVEVLSNSIRLHTQGDKATRTDKNGMSESQEYTYERQPNAAVVVYEAKLFVKGGKRMIGPYRQTRFNPESKRWKLVGGSSPGLSVGHRDAYHDFSF